MDEILASIRRIIESGDERGEAVPLAATSRLKSERSVIVERLDRQDGANVVARLSPEIDTAFLPGDEDDLEAHLRREIEADGSMHSAGASAGAFDGATFEEEPQIGGDAEADASPASPRQASAVETASEPASAADEDPATPDGLDMSGQTMPSEPDVAASKTRSEAEAEPDRVGDAPFVAANSDSRRMQGFRSAVLDDLVEGGQLDSGAALVSGRTGELVGASFDELARAIREGELRSLEDMAQELLRPMLQDWLDDNLPKLVERLVREEIERVARGGRR